MLGDPFLLTVFKDLLKKNLGDDESVLLCDLIFGCGEGNYGHLLKMLRKINSVEVTSAVYYRIVTLYFFRYHREQERKTIRKVLSELRKIHSQITLPHIPNPK